MKITFLLMVFFVMQSVSAEKNFSTEEIRTRLQMTADIYEFDGSGKVVLAGPLRTNHWKSSLETGKINGDWSSKMEFGTMAFRHSWEILADGSIKGFVEEYGAVSEGSDPQFKQMLERKELTINNFEPIVWKIKNIKERNLVLRIIPSLREISNPLSVDNLPVAGIEISVTDNSGYLWADGVQFGGKYVGLTTHRGTIGLSYAPFEGAKQIGVAEGNKITLQIDKTFQVTLKSSGYFLPSGVTAKVFAFYLPEKKSKRFNSVHTFDSNKENRFLEKFKR